MINIALLFSAFAIAGVVARMPLSLTRDVA